MAGIPLKSGADFYNLEASRMRLHNLGADPTEVGTGLIYFNTSTGMNTSGRARIYTGNGFKSLAFLEDVDGRIKTIEDMLNVDTAEGVVSTWNEIQAFLDSVQEGTDLMDMLNGKLDKTGGTISGTTLRPLIVETTASAIETQFKTKDGVKIYLGWNDIDGIYLQENVSQKYIGIKTDGTPYYYNGARNTLLHSGNYWEYALKNFGYMQDVSNSDTRLTSGDAAIIPYFQTWGGQRIGSYRLGAIRMSSGTSESQLVFDHYKGNIKYRHYGESVWSDWKTIAFTDSNVASATKLETPRTIWGQSFDGTADVDGNFFFYNSRYITSYDTNGDEVKLMNLSGDNEFSLGYYVAQKGYSTNISGNNIYLKSGTSNNIGLILNSSGNVTIGTEDKAGTSAKLYVAGLLRTDGNIHIGQQSASDTTQRYLYFWKGDGTYSHRGMMGVNEGGAFWNYYNPKNGIFRELTIGPNGLNYANNNSGTAAFTINSYGNVLIGTTTELKSGSKLQVKGDLYVEGNIIATKEVSAGGPAEESGEGGGTGGGVEPYVFTFTPSTTTVSVNHNISSEDVIVQVYEKDATSGKWSVILVDIEIVDSTRVDLHFGRTETTEHKVVIIG